MTVWEMKELCKAKMNDHSLTEQQRKAYENALVSVEHQIALMDESFFAQGVTLNVSHRNRPNLNEKGKDE